MIFSTLLINILLESLKLFSNMKHCLFTLLGQLRLHSYNAILSWISLDCVNKWWLNDLNMELVVPHLHFNHHNHYVICASFHLKKDLVICASLKQMVWIWDIGTLQRKDKAPFEDLHVWHKWIIISLEVGMLC